MIGLHEGLLMHAIFKRQPHSLPEIEVGEVTEVENGHLHSRGDATAPGGREKNEELVWFMHIQRVKSMR